MSKKIERVFRKVRLSAEEVEAACEILVARAASAPRPLLPRARKGERLGVAGGGQALQGRSTRKAEPQHPGALVERLTGGVVDRRAEGYHVPRQVVDEQQGRVAAGDQQRHRGFGQRPVFQGVHRDVRGEVVHAVDRLVRRQGTPRAAPRRKRPGAFED